MNKKVSIFMAVHGHPTWLADVLDSVTAQTYPNIELTVWDNASDGYVADVVHRYPQLHYIRHEENIGFWAAMEKLIAESHAPYIICLTDVILDPYFVQRAVETLERDEKIGAIQGKVLAMDWKNERPVRTTIIDALGFQLEHSRRVTILGHGEEDRGQYDIGIRTIFGVEGAVPVFRRTALEDCRIQGHIIDPDFRVGTIGYGDDFDLAWRITLLGWRQVLLPTAVAWHDRSTTKNIEGTGFLARHVQRRTLRQRIPIDKRRLEWSNIRFTIIKNDHTLNIIRDLPAILTREINVQGYAGLFEQKILLEWGRFLRLVPTMLHRRSAVMAKAKLNANQMRELMTTTGTRRDHLQPRSELLWRFLRAIIVLLGILTIGWILWKIW